MYLMMMVMLMLMIALGIPYGSYDAYGNCDDGEGGSSV